MFPSTLHTDTGPQNSTVSTHVDVSIPHYQETGYSRVANWPLLHTE